MGGWHNRPPLFNLETNQMIERFKSSQIKTVHLLDYISKLSDYSFYYTKNNVRYYVYDMRTLKNFLRSCSDVFVSYDRDINGVVFVEKNLLNQDSRFYIKIYAQSKKVARDLVTIILWNVHKDLYCEIDKGNTYDSVLKSKGFRFNGHRGSKILLNRRYIHNKTIYKKEEN